MPRKGDILTSVDDVLRMADVSFHDQIKRKWNEAQPKATAIPHSESPEQMRLYQLLCHTYPHVSWAYNYPSPLGGNYRLDIAAPDYKLDIEVDGWQHHHRVGPMDHDRQRDLAHLLLGWTTIRFTAGRVFKHADHVLVDVGKVLALWERRRG